MSILGLDYGRARVGLAIADGPLAQPLVVIKASDRQTLIEEIGRIISKNDVVQIVIGVSEGKMGEESQTFANLLKETFNLPVDHVDETLTTVEAQEKMLQSGKGRKIRKKLIDAIAATLILQFWLDQPRPLL